MPGKLTVVKAKEILEKTAEHLHAEETRRKNLHQRRPEEPGLTSEARLFQFKF